MSSDSIINVIISQDPKIKNYLYGNASKTREQMLSVARFCMVHGWSRENIDKAVEEWNQNGRAI